MALVELNLDYRTVDLELGQKHTDVVELSPTGKVPLLVDDGTAIWESSVILDYLDRRYAPGRLIPTDPVAEANVRLLQVYSDKIVGPCIRGLVFEKRSKSKQDRDNDVIRQAEAKWTNCLGWLEAEIGNREFFGDEFSAADCALGARFGIAEAYGAAVSDEHSGLRRWYQSVTARENWKKAYPASFIRPQ